MVSSGNDRLLLTIAIVTVVIAAISAGFVYFTIANYADYLQFTGRATDTGTANLTVETAIVVNFTTDMINWGSGRVNLGQTKALLTTLETGNVTNGNWTLTTPGGLRIENLGNVNVSLDILAGKNATSLFGGTDPGYSWNFTNLESNSCLNSTGNGVANLNHNNWQAVNTSSPGTRFCYFLRFEDSLDSVRLDLNLTVPYNSFTGALSDTITATATQV